MPFNRIVLFIFCLMLGFGWAVTANAERYRRGVAEQQLVEPLGRLGGHLPVAQPIQQGVEFHL